MRTFIALEPDVKSADRILDFERFISKETAEKLRIVKKHNIHLTLFFLGNFFDENTVKAFSVSFKKIDFKKINFFQKSVGFFPDEKKPRVIWISPDEEASEKISKIYLDLADILCEFNFEPEENFVPHITLARVNAVIEKNEIEMMKRFRIDEQMSFKNLVLFKSTLTPSGPVYEKIVEITDI